MRRKKIISEENHDSLTELVSVFHKALENVHPARRKDEITEIQIRTMMLVKAKQVCKKISNVDVANFVYQVSTSVVSRAPKLHKKFLEADVLYGNKFELFSNYVDNLIKDQEIEFS